MRLTFLYTMYIMKKGDIMTDLKNLKDHILNDVLLLGEDDIWNVIFAITEEFGIAKVPSPTGGEKGFINALVELRFKQKVEELV